MKKLLPIGISDFKKLREENYIYVDKTEYIYKLVKEGRGYYFLSRPRRFGKFLLISTLEYLFKGEKKLFNGLYIYSYNIGNKSLVIEDKWNWEETNPVVRIDFAKDIKNKEDLKEKMYQELRKNYMWNKEEIPREIKDESILLEELIMRLSEREKKTSGRISR